MDYNCRETLFRCLGVFVIETWLALQSLLKNTSSPLRKNVGARVYDTQERPVALFLNCSSCRWIAILSRLTIYSCSVQNPRFLSATRRTVDTSSTVHNEISEWRRPWKWCCCHGFKKIWKAVHKNCIVVEASADWIWHGYSFSMTR